jgi:hypothetical protein
MLTTWKWKEPHNTGEKKQNAKDVHSFIQDSLLLIMEKSTNKKHISTIGFFILYKNIKILYLKIC